MTAPDPSRDARSYYVDVSLVALAAIMLEIAYTRIFSFKLYYYFTYLVIGIALLGLGTGGVAVVLWTRLRTMALARLVTLCCLLGGAAVVLGYVIVAATQLNAFLLLTDWREPIKLVFVSMVLFAPFLAVGIVLAAVFGAYPEAIDRLYCADLIGAGLGCALTVPLISLLTPPGCVMLAALLLAGAAAHAARRDSGVLATIAALLGAVGLVAAVRHDALPDPLPDSWKTLAAVRKSGDPILFSGWSTVFRVDVTPNLVPDPNTRIINHDGHWGSVLQAFDGNVASLGRFERDPRSLPFG